jgi:hypothetical protein
MSFLRIVAKKSLASEEMACVLGICAPAELRRSSRHVLLATPNHSLFRVSDIFRMSPFARASLSWNAGRATCSFERSQSNAAEHVKHNQPFSHIFHRLDHGAVMQHWLTASKSSQTGEYATSLEKRSLPIFICVHANIAPFPLALWNLVRV